MHESGLDLIVLTSRWLHISAAIVAIGGAFFMRFALAPAAESALTEDSHAKLREAVRARWARFVHLSIAILLITGGLNFVLLALPPKIEPMPYHAIFGIKFLLALGVFFIASILVGRGTGFQGMRQNRKLWLSVLIILAGLIVLISGVLSQVRDVSPKAPISTAALHDSMDQEPELS